jgi:hypothetical protein
MSASFDSLIFTIRAPSQMHSAANDIPRAGSRMAMPQFYLVGAGDRNAAGPDFRYPPPPPRYDRGMDERRRKRRGPITLLVDWFMVDRVTTGIVMIFACWMAFITIRMAIAGRL